MSNRLLTVRFLVRVQAGERIGFGLHPGADLYFLGRPWTASRIAGPRIRRVSVESRTRRPSTFESAEGVPLMGERKVRSKAVRVPRHGHAFVSVTARDANGFVQSRVEDPARCIDVFVKELRVVVADALTAETQGLARIAGQTAVFDPRFLETDEGFLAGTFVVVVVARLQIGRASCRESVCTNV